MPKLLCSTTPSWPTFTGIGFDFLTLVYRFGDYIVLVLFFWIVGFCTIMRSNGFGVRFSQLFCGFWVTLGEVFKFRSS